MPSLMNGAKNMNDTKIVPIQYENRSVPSENRAICPIFVPGSPANEVEYGNNNK